LANLTHLTDLTGTEVAAQSNISADTAQTRLMSFAEATTNVVVGYVLAVATQLVAFPLFDLTVGLGDSLLIGLVFTAVSLGRSYVLRRFFEGLRVVRHGDRQ
jgi:hypothetical protein